MQQAFHQWKVKENFDGQHKFSFLVRFCSILKFCCSGKRSKDKDSPDYVPSVFSFTQSTEEKRRNSVDRYERLIKRQKTITSAVDNSSADTGTKERKMLRNQSKKLCKWIQQKYLSKINHSRQKNLHCQKKFIQRAYTTR